MSASEMTSATILLVDVLMYSWAIGFSLKVKVSHLNSAELVSAGEHSDRQVTGRRQELPLCKCRGDEKRGFWVLLCPPSYLLHGDVHWIDLEMILSSLINLCFNCSCSRPYPSIMEKLGVVAMPSYGHCIFVCLLMCCYNLKCPESFNLFLPLVITYSISWPLHQLSGITRVGLFNVGCYFWLHKFSYAEGWAGHGLARHLSLR